MLRSGRAVGSMTARNILFLCTGNSARSILAEALLNQQGGGRFRAYSAGSFPKGEIHPATLATLARHGLPSEGLRSKSWDEFAGPSAPELDFVITVCGNAAGEACPAWPGGPVRAHWGVPDPAAADLLTQPVAFDRAFEQLATRIAKFLALPHGELDRAELERRVREIGETADATNGD